MDKLQIYNSAFNRTIHYLKQPQYLVYIIIPAVVSGFLWSVKSLIEGIFSFISLGESSFWNDLMFQVNYLFVLTLLSPIYGILSRKIIESETGVKTADGWKELLNDIIRMLLISAIILGIQIVFIYPLYLILWLVGLSSVSTIIGFFIEAVLVGFAFFDYGLEIQRTNVSESLQFIKKQFIHCLIVGTIFLLVIKIPVLGLIVAPIILTVFATLILTKLKI